MKPPNAIRGRQLFVDLTCVDCHRVSGLTPASGTMGPVLDGLMERAAKRVPGQSAEEYVRISIIDPGRFVVRGYLNSMPKMRHRMSDQDFEDLMAFLIRL